MSGGQYTEDFRIPDTLVGLGNTNQQKAAMEKR